MATSRSRGAAGSRGGRAGAGAVGYYNDESPDVILPTPPPGSRGGGGARRGSGGSSGRGQASGTSGGRAAGGSGGRSGGSSAGRARTTASSRSGGTSFGGGRSGGGGGKGGARSGSTRGGAGRGKSTAGRGKKAPARRGRRRNSAPPPSRNLLVALTGWLLRAIVMIWLLIAGLVGSLVRRFGRNARDLHPDHKRDGVGLALLGLAIVFAAAVWVRLHNTAFTDLYLLIASVAGEGAFAIPILFGLAGWRFMRNPDRNTALPPAEIGWTTLLVGALGLLHIARGIPTLTHHGGGWDAVRTGGGLIGLGVSWPLDRGLTVWVATPLLGLLTLYGLLVVTGTPVRQVPNRFAEFKALFGYSSYDDWNDADLGDADDAEAAPGRGGKRRGEINRGKITIKGSIEDGEQRKPYDPQVLLTGGRRGGRGPVP
ncbi:MAG TPA: DNA translocase FtsK 4TM domain-containing protein, partial [Trebonia sp.]|nr:DNA translocase FtsK 4TM domain-containing protein [Trebonia sp.]